MMFDNTSQLEQRACPRHLCTGSAAVTFLDRPGVHPAKIRNVSHGGMGILMNETPNLRPGLPCEIRLKIDGEDTGVILKKGTIVQYNLEMSNTGRLYAVGLQLEENELS